MSSKLLAGRYELIEKIGEGGMAVVYKGKDRLLNRYVAIKILRPEFTRDAQFVESFKKESQAAAGLQHPNIVSVYDVGKEGNIHFIVMELIDGRPLSEVIAEQAPMDYKRCIEITRQVASALGLAHRNNIVHRDVKPHNIMITRDGVAKLADFGIAKAISDSTMVSENNRVIGSVHYFSPEQARGSYVDERSDIYSLGIVLYEMLTGQVPFDGDNPVQVALMHINDEITPPSRLVSGIPPALEKLVMKATDKYQSNRYRNANELLEDLENIEFVTRRVGNSVFVGSDMEELQEEPEETVKKKEKPKAKKSKAIEKSQQEKKSGGSNKTKKVGLAVLVAVLLVAAVGGILYATGMIGGGVKVPDVVGMTPEQAETELARWDLKMELGDEVTSDEVEKGQIAMQTPEEGERLKKGDTVTVMVSSGKPTGQIPSVVGKQYDHDFIVAYLDSAGGYELGQVTEEESDEEAGIIISQDPGAGAEAEKGTKINIVVSKGTDKVPMPSLVGKTIDDARAALEAAGLTMSNPSYEESEVYSKNIVMWQQYAEGEKVKKGTTVKVTVSMGPPDVTPSTPEPEEPANTDTPSTSGEGEDSGNGEADGE